MEVHNFVIESKGFFSVECPILVIWGHRGVVLVWIVEREDHLGVRGCTKEVVSQVDNCLSRVDVLEILGKEFVVSVEASFYSMGVHILSICITIAPLLQPGLPRVRVVFRISCRQHKLVYWLKTSPVC